ncbi:hypothetical protein BTA35_0212275 [Oceanospirillum linum]|uniref:Uncharacterized protein n=1 Tax=Oceanospirillum linum TaxID=966 RepID=A0A1T1HAA3_OCELI|nr:hypothetical protein BTA35_0212275 [Oceanospirillum linum]
MCSQIRIKQTPLFERTIKKLNKQDKKALDGAVRHVAQNLGSGQVKPPLNLKYFKEHPPADIQPLLKSLQHGAARNTPFFSQRTQDQSMNILHQQTGHLIYLKQNKTSYTL